MDNSLNYNAEPYTDEELAELRGRIERERVAGLIGTGIEWRLLATIADARRAAFEEAMKVLPVVNMARSVINLAYDATKAYPTEQSLRLFYCALNDLRKAVVDLEKE